MIVIDANCYLLSDAEVGENVVEGFLGSDLAAGDVGEVGEGEAEVFGEEVAGELVVETLEDVEEALVGTEKSVVVAGIGDDDVGVGGVGSGGKDLGAEFVEPDAVFRLEGFGLVFDADDGLVAADGDVGIGDARLCHHEDDGGTLGGGEGTANAKALDPVGSVTDASGVDETEGDAVDSEGVFDGVTCGALDVADDGAFFAKEGIEKGGFANVGRTDDGNGDAVLEGVACMESAGKMGDVGIDFLC